MAEREPVVAAFYAWAEGRYALFDQNQKSLIGKAIHEAFLAGAAWGRTDTRGGDS